METTLPTKVSDRFYRRWAPDHIRIPDLPEVYAELNATYFNGELPVLKTNHKVVKGETIKVCDQIKWEGRFKKYYGMYYPKGRKIRIASAIKEDRTQVYATVLHEMVHKHLDLAGKDDGIKGHGPNFISEAIRVNKLCEERGVTYRVNFYDQTVRQEVATYHCDLLGTVGSFTDLDIARRCESVVRAAFNGAWERRL